MKKYLIALALVGFATTSCYEKLNIAPPNRITNDQIQELLKSDPEKAEAIMSSVAAGMVPLFHEKDIRDMGGADTRYYNYADVACMRNLEANDIAAMGTDLSGSVWGMAEYNLITVFGEHDDKVPPYWYLCWDNITAANKLLDNLPMSTVGDNKKLKQYRAMGLVTRAYFYNYLMENFQQAYMLDGQANYDNKLGMMLYTSFDPQQPYKARASAAETYDSILKWSKEAVTLMKEAEVGYTSDITDIDLGVCNFNLLRVALCAGDWTTAITAGNELVAQYTKFIPKANYGWQGSKTGNLQNPISIPASGNYFLDVTNNPEVIMGWPYAQAAVQSVGSSNIEPTCIWMNPFGKGGGGLFSAIDQYLYNKMDDDDYRKNLFATTAYGSYAYPPNGTRANVPAWVNFKWANTYGIAGKAGEALSSSTVDQVGQYVMRASEAYLMLAEAQYRSGATGDAATTLNKLISARTDGAKDASNYNGGGDLWEMIKLQYRIEMWGEGREFYNNKRWNIPINRNKDYHPNATTLTFPVSGMVCKIPENEINYNPLVVQNP